MNPVIEAINNRRSTRSYEQKPIPREIINMIIEAGNQAPFTSITRSQPWRFVIVEDPELLCARIVLLQPHIFKRA